MKAFPKETEPTNFLRRCRNWPIIVEPNNKKGVLKEEIIE